MSTTRTTLRQRTRAAVIVAVATLGILAATTPASAQEDPAPHAGTGTGTGADLTATPLSPTTGEAAPTATSSLVAESDAALVASTSGSRTPVMIKLDYDAIATYAGDLRGLPATSPSVTDEPLTESVATTSAYARHVARTEADVVADMEAAVPALQVTSSFRVVYGGVSATVPANQVEQLLEVPGVVAVQADELNQLLTEETPQQIGAGPVWTGLGGQATAGNGVLFASLDTGVWPEHPSFADTGTTPTRPLRPDDGPITCSFGDDPLTPAVDPFPCNDKLVGGQAFLAQYAATVGLGDERYPDTARDSNGHGTHTASTAAGNVVDAEVLGTDRGQISGVAPGAWVVSYKVCGEAGCYGSDTAAAVQQAIFDGVDVINYSISGGSDPATDPTELAFLDAYAANLFVSASAGNSGPARDTVDHLSPWTTTVAATTPSRSFQATVAYTADGVPGTLTGTSLSGTGTGATPLPVVLASAAPYGDRYCTTDPPSPDVFAGKIVVCDNNGSRVAKSWRIMQGGGSGMILGATGPSATLTDNFWVPTVHLTLADTDALRAAIPTGATTAVLSPGVATTVPGDQIAPFSSRGPRGAIIKPDLAAPGVQVLAGTTPTPQSVAGGPTGELYQAIPGTSMAAPHVAGAAALLRDRNPSWTPGQIRSALMTTAKSGLTRAEDGSPATPSDEGSGRIRVDAAADPGLVLDETAARFSSLGLDPLNVVHLNIPSISAPKMPGKVTTQRTFTNTGGAATYSVSAQAGPGSSIKVEPSTFDIAAGASQTVTITISSSNDGGGLEYGSVTLSANGRPGLRLPVSFDPEPGEVQLTPTGCSPSTIAALETSTCSYSVQNTSHVATTVDLRAEGDAAAQVTGADQGATTTGGVASTSGVALAGRQLGVPTTAAGTSTAGYLPLDGFGITARPISDEQFTHFTVPAFVFNGVTYTTMSVSSNGYLVAGTASGSDQVCCSLTQIGDPARPNNVIAPYWTDLDGTGAPGLFLGNLTDGVNSWLVVEWRVNVFGTTSRKTFQAWIGTNGTQDISFAYDSTALPGLPSGQGLLIGAENEAGAGVGLKDTAPTGDLRVTSTAPSAGTPLTWNVQAKGTDGGTAEVTAEVASPRLPGSDLAANELTVNALPLPTITTQPQDLSVTALDEVTFRSAATGGTFVRWESSNDDGQTWALFPRQSDPDATFTAITPYDGHRFRAVYANATGHEVATRGALLRVAKIATGLELSVDPASPVRKQAVTFTADVGRTAATGPVQFAIDGVPFGNPVELAGGKATSSAITTLAAGGHRVTASYAGDLEYTPSDDSEDFEVLKIGSDTSVVTIDPDPVVVGDTVTVTVEVDPAPAGGNVQLQLDGTDAGAATALDASGRAEIELTGLAVGEYDITAVFSGDEDLASSTSDAVTIRINKITTSLEVAISPAAPKAGEAVTFQARLDPATATGTVQFLVDGEPFLSPQEVILGQAVSGTSTYLHPGPHTVEAVYDGDADHTRAEGDLDFSIAQIDSSTSITAMEADGPFVVGGSARVAVQVQPVPSGGTVQLEVGGNDAGPATALDATTGRATITLSDLTFGDHEVVAVFSGDLRLAGSSSAKRSFGVIRTQTTTTVEVSSPAPVPGQPIHFTARVEPDTATGTVRFSIDGQRFGDPVPVVDGTAASGTIDALGAGGHRVTAVYSGDDRYDGSEHSKDFGVVRRATQTTVLSVQPNPAIVGDDVVVHVDVDPAPADGTVQLQLDGDDTGPELALNAVNGEATITLEDVDAGDYDLTAEFSGDDVHAASTSETAAVTVIGGDEAFVRRAYRIVLGRDADPAGRSYWTARLGRGYDRASFIKELSGSAEGRRHTVRVAFLEVLGRDADPSGLAYWSNRLAAGTTPEGLVAELLGSNESYARGGGTPAGFAQRLYTVLLGRTGNAAGASYWTNRTAAANTPGGRRAVALGFGRSNEVTNVAVTRAGVLACGAGHVVSAADRVTMGQLWVERGHHAQRLAGTALRISCPPDES